LRRVAPLALTAALLAGCGGSGEKVVAHVGGREITADELNSVVEHFREEAKREGRQFPDDGTVAFRRLRNRLLGLLVYRAELKQAAHRLGIRVTEEQISARLPAGAEAEEDANDDSARDSVETQLLYEAIFRKVTQHVKARAGPERATRRAEAMAGFLARLKRQTPVRYEPGYAPIS
jgi:sugar phosphate isomerase/epimerase